MFSFILGLVVITAMNAQSPEMADQQFLDGDYATAMLSYENLLKQNSKSPLYLYRYARCAQETGDFNTAITYFHRAGNKYKLKHFFLAECYFKTHRMEEAINEYQQYLTVKPDTDRKDYVLNQIKLAERIQNLMKHSADVTFLDSFDVAKSDVLKVYDLSDEAGTLIQDSIFFGYKNQFGNRWTHTVPADSCIKIIRQYRLLNHWSEADTLPARVNSFSIQNSPFWLSDGVTLYFSSNNPSGLGGLDIYVTRYNSDADTYTIPKNIGLPFNSAGNDYLYVLDETRGTGYWATDCYSAPDSVRVYKFESSAPILWTATEDN
ncbi:MAG: tetratricopeptide repeat protein [Paludibacteraceae bacterium]|nr:tetratricopeptide repeat protein [Paludibacteraceae bacterium]